MRDDNPKKFETLAWKLFGKQYKELSKQELKEYYTKAKQKNRKENEKCRERDRVYGREYYRKNKKKCCDLQKKYKIKNKDKIKKQRQGYYKKHSTHKPRTESMIYKMFGIVGFKNLTLEQKREYRRILSNNWRKKE